MFNEGIGLSRFDIVTIFHRRGNVVIIPDDILVLNGDLFVFFQFGKVTLCCMSGSNEIGRNILMTIRTIPVSFWILMMTIRADFHRLILFPVIILIYEDNEDTEKKQLF